MCTEVVSTRLPESLFITVSLITKTDTKTGKIFFIKSWISRERNTLEKNFKQHIDSIYISDAINFVTKKLTWIFLICLHNIIRLNRLNLLRDYLTGYGQIAAHNSSWTIWPDKFIRTYSPWTPTHYLTGADRQRQSRHVCLHIVSHQTRTWQIVHWSYN